MKLQLTNLLPTAALLFCLLPSCKKNQDASSSSLQSNSQLTNTANLVDMGVDQQNAEVSDALGSDAMMTSDPTDCKVVTFTPSKTVYPHITTVDFGSGCTDILGKTTSGKRLTIVYADSRTAPAGTLVSITTYSNFYENAIGVSGSSKTYVASVSPFGLKTVAAKSYTDGHGTISAFSATYYHLQIAGNATENKDDDVYEVTGNSFGVEHDKGGVILSLWRSTIDPNNKVIKASNCPARSQGAVNIYIDQKGVKNSEYLNYGDGTCDNKATLSVNNGSPEAVTLPIVFYAAHL